MISRVVARAAKIEALEAFVDQYWSLEAIGEALFETDRLAAAIAGLLRDGKLVQVVEKQVLPWVDSLPLVIQLLRSEMILPDGKTILDFQDLSAAFRPPKRKQRIRGVVDIYAGSIRSGQIPHEQAHDPEAVVLAHAQSAIAKIDHAIDMAIINAFRVGQVLVFQENSAGFEVLRPEVAAEKLLTNHYSKNSHRFIFARDIPKAILRYKGEGPNQLEKIRMYKEAEEYFLEHMAKTAAEKRWRKKDTWFDDMKGEFCDLSRNQFDKIWRENATEDMKAGRKDPSERKNPRP